MVKKISFRITVILGLFFLLAACGSKSQESVVKKLEEKVAEMNGYKTSAEMKMSTGQADQTYKIDVWHKQKDFYRVALSSSQDEKGGQVILKNKDGVYVLTPALNKSFKFQAEWPENSSMPYLFQSLVKDIKKDIDAEFEATDSHYIFRTKTNYQSSNNLPFQEIHFDKKTFTPVLVKVLDKDKKPLVEVKFSKFEMNPSFNDKDFTLEENMTTSGGLADVPVSGHIGREALIVLTPTTTFGSELMDKKEVAIENGQRVIMNYKGEKNFTLVEEKLDVVPTISMPQEVNGDIVNLGYALGAMEENAIEWHYNGMNFYLASDELTKEELIEVAQSVTNKEVK